MNEEEIQEALKVIKEPITVNSIEYKYFDQENYEKLLRVYENCQWFINIHEQLMQNLDNLHQELDRYKNNWEELKKFCKSEIENGIKTDFNELIASDFKITITCYEFILDKMKELEEE